MLKRIFISLSTIACLASCGQTKMPNNHSLNNTIPSALDTSKIAILGYDTADNWIFKQAQPANITNNDLKIIDTTLNTIWKEFDSAQAKRFEEVNIKHPEYKLRKEDIVINFMKYKRQYIAVINSNGEKEVSVNCFCAFTGESWKKEIVLVDDGGICYFNLKINLTTGKYYDYMENGIG